jgi:hypothetical protein
MNKNEKTNLKNELCEMGQWKLYDQKLKLRPNVEHFMHLQLTTPLGVPGP